MLEQARRAKQTVTSYWMPIEPVAIAGVHLKEIKNVPIRSGVLTECFRPEWFDPPLQAAHVVYMSLLPGGLSSWHCHRTQNDVIIGVRGQLRIGIYDDRVDSPTYKQFQMLHVSVSRPVAIQVPPLVWHAIKNPTGSEAAYIVVNDQPFHYEEPDDWTLPRGSDAIPYSLD